MAFGNPGILVGALHTPPSDLPDVFYFKNDKTLSFVGLSLCNVPTGKLLL